MSGLAEVPPARTRRLGIRPHRIAIDGSRIRLIGRERARGAALRLSTRQMEPEWNTAFP
jgi:hypothetical protein